MPKVRSEHDKVAVEDQDALLHRVARDVGDQANARRPAKVLVVQKAVRKGLLGFGAERG